MKNPAPDLAWEQDKGWDLERLADGKITILYFSNTKPAKLKTTLPSVQPLMEGGFLFI